MKTIKDLWEAYSRKMFPPEMLAAREGNTEIKDAFHHIEQAFYGGFATVLIQVSEMETGFQLVQALHAWEAEIKVFATNEIAGPTNHS